MSDYVGRKRGRPKSFNDKSDSIVIQSLDRAMGLLKVVAANKGMSLTEIAETAGQPASSVYRVLVTLQKHTMVEFDEAGQLWHVGLAAFQIGNAFLGRTSLVEQSRSIMQDVMVETGETANLAIVDDAEVVFLSQVETQEPIRAFFRPGTRGPVHASGIGKALLAYFPRQRVEAIIQEHDLVGYTGNTITDKAALASELEQARERGWAVDDEERNNGMRCIAAPIFNPFGEAIAGLSVSGPSDRVRPDQDERLGELIKAAADQVTKAIGGRQPSP